IASNTTLALSIFLTANIADYEEPPPTTIDFDIDEAPAPYASEQSAEIAEDRRTIDEEDARIDDLIEEVERPESDIERIEADISSVGKRAGVAEEAGEEESQGRQINVEATAYTAYCDTGCTGVTATGVDVSQSIYHAGKRVIAVDPAVIPLGSEVIVKDGGQEFEAVAEDTGGDINGNRIDILVDSIDEAKQLGRQSVNIEIINEGER